MKLKNKEYYVMQWNTQEGNITTKIKIKIDFTLTEFSATKIVMWEFYVDDPAIGICDMILSRYI